jgi:hypothetical protein
MQGQAAARAIPQRGGRVGQIDLLVRFGMPLSLVSVAKLVDFELGQVSYTDFIGITVLPCG